MTAPIGKISLRYYQQEAVDAYISYLKSNKKGNGVIVLPTGSGKAYLLSELTRIFAGDYGGRVVTVSHTKKIVKQDYDSACKLWPEGKELFGINSDGLGMRSTKRQVLFCGIQSVYKSAEAIGKVNLLIIDESHRVDMDGAIQYKSFINDLLKINPKIRICGLTATEYRQGIGLIYGPSSLQIFDDLVYQANTKELIKKGFLAKPIVPKIKKEARINTDGLPVSTGPNKDYLEPELMERANIQNLIDLQTTTVLDGTKGHESIASFAVNIEHAESIAWSYRKLGEKSIAVVHSKIDYDDTELVEDFENGKIRVLVSVNMFIEGFDAPNIQILDVRKPTKSPGRYVQMVGRGFRLCKEIGKKTFIVFDFAGNVGEHGPVDEVSGDYRGEKALSCKKCKNCGEEYHPRLSKCPYCGYKPESMHTDWEDKSSSDPGKLSIISKPKWFEIDYLHCAKPNLKKGIPSSIVVHYYCVEKKKFTKEISFDKGGKLWLKMHLGDDIPFDVQNFFKGGYRTKIRNPKRIFVDEAGASSTILKYEF